MLFRTILAQSAGKGGGLAFPADPSGGKPSVSSKVKPEGYFVISNGFARGTLNVCPFPYGRIFPPEYAYGAFRLAVAF
jgi:hypothetical protein